MRVLMTADAVGGVWTYAIDLMTAARDVEFVVATMGARPNAAQREQVPPNARLVESDYELEWQDDPWRDVEQAGAWLLALEKDVQPDVVHLNGFAHAALPFAARKLVVGHSCVLSWWRAVKGEDAPPSWDRYREAVQEGLAGASLIVAPSAWMLGALDEHYHSKAPKKLIYNGRAPHPQLRGPLSPLAPGEGCTESRRADEGRRTIFAAGRLWDEAKNIRAVVDAAPFIDAPVEIAGDGGASAPNVTHLGRLDRDGMQQAFARAAIYLFPALYEPFGLSILEAAMAGCPLVIGDIPSLREIWGGAALFVPPRNPHAIAHAVNEVLADDALRAELSRRAAERAAAYSLERMSATYRDTWRTLAVPAEVRA